jgi:asparagine synthase (glutamine-hydrolysing)
MKTKLLRSAIRKRIGGTTPFDAFRSVFDVYKGSFETLEDFVDASLYFELRTFLPGLLLVEDKLSMAHSLETRVPFLDDDVVELATRLPARMKLRDLATTPSVDENQIGKRLLLEHETSAGKPILRAAMQQILPADVVGRGKQGFSAPDASWFRGESIDYIDRLLRDPRARIYEFLEPGFVGAALDEHMGARVNRRLMIWSLLSLEWWCRVFLDGDVPTERPVAESVGSGDVQATHGLAGSPAAQVLVIRR